MSLTRTIQSDGKIYTLAVTPDGALIVAGCDSDVAIWDTRTGHKFLGPLKGHGDLVRSVAVSIGGGTLASGSQDHTIRIWDIETGDGLLEPLTGHAETVRSVAFSPDGQLLVSGSEDCTIRIWDARTGQPVRDPIRTGSSVYSVAVSSDGKKIAAGCSDNAVRVYDTARFALIFQCKSHTSTILSVVFSLDGRFLAAGSCDSTVYIWDAATGSPVSGPLRGHTDYVRSISFSPDGSYVASGSDDKTVRVWNTGTGQLHGNPLSGHTDYVYAVAFTPDGRFLVSGSDDKTINISEVHIHLPDNQNARESSNSVGIEITNGMSLRDILSRLSTLGCVDMSPWLDKIAAGHSSILSFGGIYPCKLNVRDNALVKQTRIYSTSNEEGQASFTRAIRDILAWSRCRHPNLEPLLGVALFRDRICTVESWDTSRSLLKHFEHHPEVDRCKMSIQVAEGLAHLHILEMVHSDLKAANVFVSRCGVAKIGGFGGATLHDEALEFSVISSKDVPSARWAAPELFKDKTYTNKTDVYALGMTILEIITGKVPWVEKSVYMAIYSTTVEMAHPERPMQHIPAGSIHGDILWSIMSSCWKFEAENRPSAATVASLMKCITQEGLKAT
ncbi:Tyrosine kinase family catalytic domain protein [Ceratobasidium sp. AG-Ba]|nr:Tyrosine kinase family catalytic domain protein [Ceratobasidium sp. AG-Ba]